MTSLYKIFLEPWNFDVQPERSVIWLKFVCESRISILDVNVSTVLAYTCSSIPTRRTAPCIILPFTSELKAFTHNHTDKIEIQQLPVTVVPNRSVFELWSMPSIIKSNNITDDNLGLFYDAVDVFNGNMPLKVWADIFLALRVMSCDVLLNLLIWYCIQIRNLQPNFVLFAKLYNYHLPLKI